MFNITRNLIVMIKLINNSVELMMQRKVEFDILSNLVHLSGAGLAMTLANPFELIRYRMQTMPQLLKQGILTHHYKGILDCVQRVVKQEGIKGFWKGNLANLMRFYPSQTINFSIKQVIQGEICYRDSLNRVPRILKTSSSGIIGGWITLFLLYPFEYSRLKLSNDILGNNGGILKCLSSTLKLEGLRGVYRGILISFVGVAVFRGIYFGIFDYFKHNAKNSFERWILGYFSTFMAIVCTYPSDTVRRRIMMTSCQNYKYFGFVDCTKHVYKTQGLKSFYRGGSMIMFQSVAGASILFLYDKIARELKNLKSN